MDDILNGPGETGGETGVGRRAAFAFFLAAAAIRPARAAEGRAAIPDLAISCDRTLQPALRRAVMLFNARTRVNLFSAPPPLMLAQIERETQTDLLMTSVALLDDGARRGLVKPEARADGWRNRLVVVARAEGAVPVALADVPRSLGDARFAVTDPTIMATFDGRAVLARLELESALSSRLIGAADTRDVAFLVQTGVARLGLVQRTDANADPMLAVVAAIPDDAYPPTTYGIAAAATVASPTAEPFMQFLRTDEARKRMAADGLESAT